MSKTLKEKQLSFLVETAEHYTAYNRCVDINGVCTYSPAIVGKVGESEGCAIGRKLDTDLALKLDRLGSGASVKNKVIWNLLPEDMRELGQDFLSFVQDLHDTERYWNYMGLSEQGLKKFFAIVKFINDEVEE